MNSVVHFEMPYDNPERVAKFYRVAFGWETKPMGADMDNYVLATTTEIDRDRMPTHPGAINGGFFPRKSDMPAQYPSVVIAVEDITEATDRVTRAGGRVLGDPIDIPGVGMYVSFMDSEGNRVGMLEPSRRDSSRQRKRPDRSKNENEPASPGSRITPVGSKGDQSWSPRHVIEPVAEERDDSYGAVGTHSGAKKARSKKKSGRGASAGGGRRKTRGRRSA